MDLTPKEYSVEFGGKTLTFKTGQMAQQADGAVVVQYGDTVVLATAVIANTPREGVDFLPLMVDYEERLYAAGKISGSRFIKREGRPTETAVLNARLIDRPLRPLFPKGFRNDVQVIATVLSMDGENDADIPAMIGASAALSLTNAPFEGPIAGVRVGRIDGEFIVNPTFAQQAVSELDLVISATKTKVMMLEAGASVVPEAIVVEGIEFGHAAMQPVFEVIEKMKADRSHQQADEMVDVEMEGSDIHSDIHGLIGTELAAAVREMDKEKREALIKAHEQQVMETFEGNYKQVDLKSAFGKLLEKQFRHLILTEGIRPDGRKLDEIRPIDCQVGLLPRTHGSALFTRGQTQALSIVTLGGPGEAQMIDTLEMEGTKRFMHHYNFPPFSVGEVKPLRGTGRREIGHGALAERALLAIIPDKDTFPYTIRVVSETLSSNGSSSMASTCGMTLALMDAGVPIKAPVAGIAIGLITEEGFNDKENGDYKLLTDIQGIEDFGGDMDFKVTGTSEGVTAIQLDMKVKGLPIKMLAESIERARIARLSILKTMAATLAEPRAEMSQYAPRIITVKIPVKKIGDIIGPGGKTINKIIDAAGGKTITTIDIDEDGTVNIASTDPELGRIAAETIEGLVADVEVGQIYQGTVIGIQKDRMSGKEIGAIVQVLPNKDGMVHISELSNERVDTVSSVVKMGDKFPVKVMAVDAERGRISLSKKRASETSPETRI